MMSVGVDHPVVAAYLAQLDAAAAAAGLAAGRRAELRAEIRAHVDDALGPDPDPSGVTVAAVIDRLGPPEEIVAAESGADGPPWTAAAGAGRWGTGQAVAGGVGPDMTGRADEGWGALEWVALALLTLGQLLPVIGPLAGVFCAWSSQRWNRGQKVAATVAGLLGVVLLVLGGAFFLASGGSSPVGSPVPAVVAVTPSPVP